MDLLNITNRTQIMNFIRWFNRANFYFSNLSFEILWLISGMEVMIKYKISAQHSPLSIKTRGT